LGASRLARLEHNQKRKIDLAQGERNSIAFRTSVSRLGRAGLYVHSSVFEQRNRLYAHDALALDRRSPLLCRDELHLLSLLSTLLFSHLFGRRYVFALLLDSVCNMHKCASRRVASRSHGGHAVFGLLIKKLGTWHSPPLSLRSGRPVLGNRINFVNHSILTICNGAGERAQY
jgi:hypothetical protein